MLGSIRYFVTDMAHGKSMLLGLGVCFGRQISSLISIPIELHCTALDLRNYLKDHIKLEGIVKLLWVMDFQFPEKVTILCLFIIRPKWVKK